MSSTQKHHHLSLQHAGFSCFNRKTFTAGLVLLLAVIFTGCSRSHYRVQADTEVYSLLASGGTRDPRWKLDDYRINVKKKSRMFDPHHPDCEPMPKDDPSAHRKMLSVDGKKGAKDWYKYGVTDAVENPFWKQSLLLNTRGAVDLNKDAAIDLALLHSPEYQSAFENLYLAAMKVSQERFRFDVQFYGGESLFYTAAGKLRASNSSVLQNDIDFGANKKFATGGELVAGLANSVTWNFSGSDYWSADSILNFAFVQPLLRSAGRRIVLEELTQSERDFLAAIRQMVFFQQGYYTKIVTGSGGQSAPSGRSGSSVPSYGGGFYGLLAEQIQIQNQRQNIVSLEDNLNLLQEFFEAGQLEDRYQVEQTRQNLLNSESQLLNRMSQLRSSIDTYLCSLGLPPDLEVDIDDPLIERFQLTSPTLTKLQEQMNSLLSDVRKKDQPLPDNFVETLQKIVKQTESEINGLDNDLAVLQKQIPNRISGLNTLESLHKQQSAKDEQIDAAIFDSDIFKNRVAELCEKEIPKCLRCIRAAIQLVDLIIKTDEPTLRAMITAKSYPPEIKEAVKILEEERLVIIQPEPEDSKAVPQPDRYISDLRDSTQKEMGDKPEVWRKELANRLVPKVEGMKTQTEPLNIDFKDEPDTSKQLQSRKTVSNLGQKDDYRDWVRRVLAAFQNEILSLTLAQTRVRLDSITLDQTDISAEDAFHLAAEHRLDWMNRKAGLVDVWRQIEIAANKLKGDLNVKVNGEIGTIDKRGVRFDGDNGRLSVGLEWDTPLTRHNEMMAYRQSQIDYQSARRAYYTYVDSVQAELRRILRNLQNDQVEFEIKRSAIISAATQVDLMQLKLSRPPSRGSRLDTNTARDLIDGLNGLTDRQNEFLNTWIACQTQRMLLDLNMGTMQLDEKGRWVEPGVITKDRSISSTSTPALPPSVMPLKMVPPLPPKKSRTRYINPVPR
ncbi:MAG: TolC family protein [Planctomycetaceae bacterium]|jgi:outer membrane protein TolC|nr:TolC family protein [Planctomycetaceae bacterium]